MGQDQSIPHVVENKQLHQQNLQKKRELVTSISHKLSIDIIEASSLVTFLERNGYLITDMELGRGGFGIVLGGETTNKESIAIKVVKCIKRGQSEDIIKEFNILKLIQSRNVVRAIDLLQFETQNVNLLITVMERCETNLISHLRHLRASCEKYTYQQKVYEICSQLIKGITEIHAANILHLDIKPTNIMMGKDKQWKFIDMGISVMLQEQHFINNCGLTQLYSSPEQYKIFMNSFSRQQQASAGASVVTKQSDIYSLGLVFLEMTGIILDKKVTMQIKQTLQQAESLQETQFDPSFAAFNQKVILQMIQFNQERRLSTEGIERQLSSLQFEASQNAQIELKNQSPTKQFIKSNPISRQSSLQDNSSPVFSLISISNQSTFSNMHDLSVKTTQERISLRQVPSPTRYDTSHLFKEQNLQSKLQRDSFNCQKFFNQNAGQSHPIEHRCTDQFYSNTHNNSPSSVTNNYKYSTIISSQY